MGNHTETDIYFIDKTKKLLDTMPEIVKQYTRAIHNRTSPRTRYEYLKDIDQFLRYLKTEKHKTIDLQTLNDCSKLDFEEYFEHLEKYQDANGKIITNQRISIKRKMSSLRKFFAYLFENNLITADQIRKVEMPKLHKKTIIRLEQDEASAFLEDIKNGNNLTKKESDYHSLQSCRDFALANLLLSTGMRVSECSELNIEDIDMKRCSAKITRKGGSESVVYFSDDAAKYLQEYLNTREDIDDPTSPLFLSSRKTRLSTRAIEVIVKKYAARSVPNKHITPHKLRATFATELYNATNDIYLVAETLGHNDISTTKEHYANLSEKHKADNRNRVSYNRKESENG